jgi:hypothetical protein
MNFNAVFIYLFLYVDLFIDFKGFKLIYAKNIFKFF